MPVRLCVCVFVAVALAVVVAVACGLWLVAVACVGSDRHLALLAEGVVSCFLICRVR